MDGFIAFITYSIIAYLLGYWLYITVMWLRLLHREWKSKGDPRPSLEEGIDNFHKLTNEIHGKGWREKIEKKKVLPKEGKIPNHLRDFSKIDNVNIAWEKVGGTLKETFFDESLTQKS